MDCLFRLSTIKRKKHFERGAFFYSQRFIKNFVYTLLENNRYICLISNQ